MKPVNKKERIDVACLQTIDSLLPAVIMGAENWLESWKSQEEIDENQLPEVLFITSFPPRECGIATYSQDLITALNNKFGTSFNIKVCAMESGKATYKYADEVTFVLDTSDPLSFKETALKINMDIHVKIVVVQHEFGFFSNQENSFLNFSTLSD